MTGRLTRQRVRFPGSRRHTSRAHWDHARGGGPGGEASGGRGLIFAAVMPRSVRRFGGEAMKRRFSLATAAVAIATAAALWMTVPAGAAAGHQAVSGPEHFQLMSTSATSNTASVIASGVFTA